MQNLDNATTFLVTSRLGGTILLLADRLTCVTLQEFLRAKAVIITTDLYSLLIISWSSFLAIAYLQSSHQREATTCVPELSCDGSAVLCVPSATLYAALSAIPLCNLLQR